MPDGRYEAFCELMEKAVDASLLRAQSVQFIAMALRADVAEALSLPARTDDVCVAPWKTDTWQVEHLPKNYYEMARAAVDGDGEAWDFSTVIRLARGDRAMQMRYRVAVQASASPGEFTGRIGTGSAVRLLVPAEGTDPIWGKRVEGSASLARQLLDVVESDLMRDAEGRPRERIGFSTDVSVRQTSAGGA